MIKDLFATKNEAAILLNVDVATIWRWIHSGKLTAEKVGNVVFAQARADQHYAVKHAPGAGRRHSHREAKSTRPLH